MYYNLFKKLFIYTYLKNNATQKPEHTNNILNIKNTEYIQYFLNVI